VLLDPSIVDIFEGDTPAHGCFHQRTLALTTEHESKSLLGAILCAPSSPHPNRQAGMAAAGHLIFRSRIDLAPPRRTVSPCTRGRPSPRSAFARRGGGHLWNCVGGPVTPAGPALSATSVAAAGARHFICTDEATRGDSDGPVSSLGGKLLGLQLEASRAASIPRHRRSVAPGGSGHGASARPQPQQRRRRDDSHQSSCRRLVCARVWEGWCSRRSCSHAARRRCRRRARLAAYVAGRRAAPAHQLRKRAQQPGSSSGRLHAPAICAAAARARPDNVYLKGRRQRSAFRL